MNEQTVVPKNCSLDLKQYCAENFKDPRMVFLAHWVESWNWLLWFFSFLHTEPQRRFWLIWLYPLCWLMSLIYLIGKKPFNVVDKFIFCVAPETQLRCRTALIRNFGWHFFFPGSRDKIRKRIIAAVLALQDSTDVMGLGALVKDARITHGGELIVNQLGDRLRVPIVHGDTLTAATVIKQAIALFGRYHVKSPVFLTGSTSKIGRAVAIGLARQGIKVLMYTQDEARFQAIAAEAGEAAVHLRHVKSLHEGNDCSLWITGKSIPRGAELYDQIPEGAVVMNFAVPNPLSDRDFRKRKDIKRFEGGLLAYDPDKTTLNFRMRLQPGITYACHAGTMVHAMMGWKHHEVGPVDLEKMHDVWQAAFQAGFSLPPID